MFYFFQEHNLFQLLEILDDENYRFDVDKRKLFLFNHFHGISNLKDDELEYVLGNDYFVNGEKIKKNSDCGWYVRNFNKGNNQLIFAITIFSL